MLRKEYTVYCFEILWIGHMLRYTQMVFQSLQPQSLCYFVDQLDTA